ncbi:hypothetical protein [Epilithonimonas lactis]|uniref:Uncharacterized protein n=1 Tax=Epilithonimonas lactis TaxID=421072 RepID=A0A085BL18_9FLAO|nr:hypothetical protein [Epilithonimonas lactis]KFC23163.1 hypothetical protein IO89_00745 [Epilithonimonas lactis]SEQ03685.1 hypothetical protein SAMN04488097_1099 [Epilithonimonas lactis]
MILTFAIPNRENWEAQESGLGNIGMAFGSRKKTSKKFWWFGNIFILLHSQIGNNDRTRFLRMRKERSSLT